MSARTEEKNCTKTREKNDKKRKKKVKARAPTKPQQAGLQSIAEQHAAEIELVHAVELTRKGRGTNEACIFCPGRPGLSLYVAFSCYYVHVEQQRLTPDLHA